MAKKRTALDSIIAPKAGKPTSKKLSRSSKAEVKEATGQQAAPKRPHVKQQALYLKHPIHRQLRVLAFEEEKKMHDLCMEALDLLFADRGLPSIQECLDKE